MTVSLVFILVLVDDLGEKVLIGRLFCWIVCFQGWIDVETAIDTNVDGGVLAVEFVGNVSGFQNVLKELFWRGDGAFQTAHSPGYLTAGHRLCQGVLSCELEA